MLDLDGSNSFEVNSESLPTTGHRVAKEGTHSTSQVESESSKFKSNPLSQAFSNIERIPNNSEDNIHTLSTNVASKPRNPLS